MVDDDLTEEEVARLKQLQLNVEVGARFLADAAYARVHGMSLDDIRKLFEIQLAGFVSTEESLLQRLDVHHAGTAANKKMRTAAGLDLKSVPLNDKPKGDTK